MACCATCSASPTPDWPGEAAVSASRLIDLERRQLPGRYGLARFRPVKNSPAKMNARWFQRRIESVSGGEERMGLCLLIERLWC